MLVYGDRPRRERPRERLAALAAMLAGLPPAGIQRHAALVEAFIAAAELAQGLADAEFEARGSDARSARQDAAMAVVMAIARAVAASWRSGFAPSPATVDLSGLERQALPETVAVKTGEGYAFYALYPEAYAVAAERLEGARPSQVVGLRSIGVGLSAMVAEALDAPAPDTVRPVGHPFRRTLALSDELAAELAEPRPGGVAVVDEGPGLSGSSFAAAASALGGRMVFFPSHTGEPGAEADPDWRARWRAAEKAHVGFEALALETDVPAHRLEAWVEDLVGPAIAPLEDLSGGAWRERLHGAEAAWPAADTFRERRKFLLRTGGGPWLLKFAGLGGEGRAKLERARALAEAGFAPEVAGLRHGFLVERWIEGSRPLDPAAFGRDRLAAHLARYLALRADRLPAPEAGADAAALYEMARVNTAEALGGRAATRLEAFESRLGDLRLRPVETDGRLHLWEWRLDGGGRLLKTDAVDHAHAHDLVGPQDIAWDVAGAVAELDLGEAGAAALAEALGDRLDPLALAFLRPAYLAFQLGSCAMAAAAHAGWPAEAARLMRERDRYADALSRLLA